MASIERPSDSPGLTVEELLAGEQGDEHRYLVARAAGQRVAIALLSAREILTVRAVTRLPGAPNWVAGLVNVRGSVLTVLDAGTRLGGTASTGPVIVIELEAKRYGLRVDAVDGVERATGEAQQVEEARSAQGAVNGLATMPSGAALVLDVAALQRAAIADA